MKRTVAFTLAVGLLVAWPVSSFADSITQLVVFGDSLSDTGNVYLATGGKEPAPPAYTAGLFTDGPDSFPSTTDPQGVWIQQLAGMMGLPLPGPSLAAGGTDYAFGGALTGHDPNFPGGGGVPYVGDQLNLYLASHPGGVPSNSLYSFWAGANDIFTGENPQTAVKNLTADINTLFAHGAKDFLWLDLPPLGDTPDGLASGQSAALNLLSQEYDAAWLKSIGLLDKEDPGIKIVGVDVYGLVESMLADPSKYGFSNVTTPAQGLSVDPNTYLYWDGVHPTTEGHYWVANLAAQDLAAPELPASLLFGTALLGAVLVFGRRQRASAEPIASAVEANASLYECLHAALNRPR